MTWSRVSTVHLIQVRLRAGTLRYPVGLMTSIPVLRSGSIGRNSLAECPNDSVGPDAISAYPPGRWGQACVLGRAISTSSPPRKYSRIFYRTVSYSVARRHTLRTLNINSVGLAGGPSKSRCHLLAC